MKINFLFKLSVSFVFTFYTVLKSDAQSLTLNPNNLQIPSVSALPGCAAVDYGKIVFLTTTNKANVCSGTGWIEVSTGAGGGGSLTLPFAGNLNSSTSPFSIVNTGGGANSSAIQGTTLSGLTDAAGVWGSANTTSPTGFNAGVRGSNLSTNVGGFGVYGTHAGTGFGVYGTSVTGFGVAGVATGLGTGVSGSSNQIGATGVIGNVSGNSSLGVYGRTTNGTATAGFFENSGANGIALHTSGKLRFQGNGAAANRVLVSQDANGNANWEPLTRTEILSLGPAAFSSHISSNECVMGGSGISFNTVAGSSGSLHANVSLPNGSTITGYTAYYIDNDGAGVAGLGLTGHGLQKAPNSASGSYSNIANGAFTNWAASTAVQSNAMGTLSEVVNNATHFYRLVISMPLSANLTLVGVIINYSYTLNN